MDEKLMTEEMLPEEQEQIFEKKSFKKEIGRMGWGLILYMVLNVVIVYLDLVRQIAHLMTQNGSTEITDEQILAMAENAGSMIVAVFAGVLFLWIFMGKRVDTKEMFASRRKMNASALFEMLGILMFVQMIFSGVISLMEAGLNAFGYTAMGSIESATGSSNTISMFLYASFVGPIVEELVYRGFVMQSLRKYGTMFAMVLSSFLFGIMHGNIAQIPFAFFVGLVLAYIAQEYSLKWAMIVHIINNFVFVELIALIGKMFGETAEILLSNMAFMGLAVVGAVVLWKKRNSLKAYAEENKSPGQLYTAAFTTVSIALFTVENLLIAIAAIEPLI